MENIQYRAYVWGGWRPVRSCREITRGKHKGKVLVQCLYNPGRLKGAIINSKDLREVAQ